MPETIYGGCLANKRKHELQEIARAMGICVNGTPKKAALTKLIQDELDACKEVYFSQAQFRGLYVSARVARKPATRRSLSPPVVYPNISYQYDLVPQSDDSTDELHPTWVCAEYPVARRWDSKKKAKMAEKADMEERMNALDRTEDGEAEGPIYISSDVEPPSEHEEGDDREDNGEEDDDMGRSVSSQKTTSTVTATTILCSTPIVSWASLVPSVVPSTSSRSSSTPSSTPTPTTTSTYILAVATSTSAIIHVASPTRDTPNTETRLGSASCYHSALCSSSTLPWPGQLTDKGTSVSPAILEEHVLLASDDVSNEMKTRWEIRKRKAWDEFLREEDQRQDKLGKLGKLGRLERLEKLEKLDGRGRSREGDTSTGWSSRSSRSSWSSMCSANEGSTSSRDEAEEAVLDELAVERFLTDMEAAVCAPIRRDLTA